MKSKATGCGSISAIFSSIVLLCFSSIIIVIIVITTATTMDYLTLENPHGSEITGWHQVGDICVSWVGRSVKPWLEPS